MDLPCNLGRLKPRDHHSPLTESCTQAFTHQLSVMKSLLLLYLTNDFVQSSL
uniref:Uncharacterized protein n=1 Tax=Anguilla anguilla TaxID=7936 RepID=A0A0E9W167_ANGAN